MSKPNYIIDSATNRLMAPAGYNHSYDNAGNQTNDNYTGGGVRTFDAENHIIAGPSVGGTWQYYKNSGSGLRVRRIVNGSEVWQVYGICGLINSTEYAQRSRTDGQFITDLYWTYCQRNPDAGGYQA